MSEQPQKKSNTQTVSNPAGLLSIERELFQKRTEILAAKDRDEEAAGQMLAAAGVNGLGEATDTLLRSEKELAALDRGISAVRTQRIAAIHLENAAQASA